MRVRRRVFEIVEVALPGDKASRAFDVGIAALICANIVAMVLQSIEHIDDRHALFFYWFEAISVGVFTIEYVLRLWTCVENPAYARPLSGRIRFAFRPLVICDLLAFLPFYAGALLPDLRALRVFRVLRILRIAKLGRYSSSMQVLITILREKKFDLIAALIVMLVLMLVASCLMYTAERDAQPEVFSSIPAAMWWAVATMTTVGYGDIYPITVEGKLIASVISILGIGMFAIPAGILGSAFVEVRRRRSSEQQTCPHCGAPLSEPGM